MAIEFTYFKGFNGGRGEPVRIALHASGVAWKDTSITFPELKEAKEKGKFLTGLPALKTASGKEFSQSVAMTRYAGKLGSSGLYPTDPEEAMAVDCAMDICQDALTKCPQEPDEEVKKTKREEYAAGKLKSFMDELTAIIGASGGPFVCGSKLTVADLVITFFVIDMITSGNFDYVPKTYLDAWPALAKFSETVKDHAIVKAYYASTATA